MDNVSELELSKVDPALTSKIRAASDLLNAEGTFIRVYSGFRTAAQENSDYAQGRTAPGHIITNARAGYSMHNYGLAADIVPFRSGDSGILNWDTKTPQYQQMVAALKAQGLEYGGDWKSFPDMDHFQMTGLPPSPNHAMVADYQAGIPLDVIWANMADGKYSI